MDTSNNSFAWLERELSSIRSRRFHIFESLPIHELSYEGPMGLVRLTGDYATFLAHFGYARLFCDHRDAPALSVYSLKPFRRYECGNGKVYIGFGFRGQQSVFFDEQEILSNGCSKVYVVSKKGGKEIAQNFGEWFKSAYDWVRSKYSPSQWKRIVEGPKPFSEEEMLVVETRRQFQWRHCGFSEDGDAIFEVVNNSPRRIPYLTIGIRDKNDAILVGAVWLDVERIGPGEKGILKKDCYKDHIPPQELVPFDLPEPIPEKREAYWEFGMPS